jgi:hypothetical protein
MKYIFDVLENYNCKIRYTKYMLDVFSISFFISNFLNDNVTY